MPDVYGASETSKSFANEMLIDPDGAVAMRGAPQDSTVEIIDDAGAPCAVGQSGHVRVRNGYMAAGNPNAPEASAKAFRDGWFYPCDTAHWGKNGELVVLGRADDVINFGGYKIQAALVDALISTVPGAREAVPFRNLLTAPKDAMIAFVVYDDPGNRVNVNVDILARINQTGGFGLSERGLRSLTNPPLDEDRLPDREAIVAPDMRLSHVKLWQVAQAFALNMQVNGIGQGVTAELQSRDMIASVAVMAATALAATALVGARLVVHTALTGVEPGPLVLLHSPESPPTDVPPGVRLVAMTAEWSPCSTVAGPDTAKAFPGAIVADAPWWTIHTSGTTGDPKALILSRKIAFDRSIAVARDFRGAETRFCSIFPCWTRPFFVRAMAALVNGATILDSKGPTLLAAEGANLFAGSPRKVLEWLIETRPKDRLPIIHVSGAPFSDKVALKMLATFDVLFDAYGSGESNKSFVNRRHLHEGKMTRTGLPQDTAVEVRNSECQPCVMGEVRELRVRNSYLVPGYRDAPAASARSFRDGWFHPGDLARREANGALVVVGRVDQIINLGGIKIDPLEVEAVLLQVRGVRQAAVFLDPREQTPPRTMAFLVLAPSVDIVSTIDAVVAHCTQRLTGTKAPSYFYVVPDISVTHDGVPRGAECARIARDLPGEG